MSVDPNTGMTDGPYVLIGGQEYTLAEAQQVALALIAAVETAGLSRSAQLGCEETHDGDHC